MRRVALAILIVVLTPSAAFAGSAQVQPVPIASKYMDTVAAVVYTAAPGERNHLVLSRDPATAQPGGDPAFVLSDAGAGIVAGPGCTVIDERTVRCAANTVVIDSGDGDDTVAVPVEPDEHTAIHASGGAGADGLTGAGNLSGGPGPDVLVGSPPGCSGRVRCPTSTLYGGTGNDVLRGGAGDEVLVGDGDGPRAPGLPLDYSRPDPGGGDDMIDGGGGRDVAEYSGRGSGVRIDLATGVMAGPRGERDRLKGIEDVTGGDGADVLAGDAGPNVLSGGPGGDRLSGRGGDDELLANREEPGSDFDSGSNAPDGADTLRGGDGDDLLDAQGGRNDALFGGDGDDGLASPGPGSTLECGRGDDRLASFRPQGQLLADCERLTFGGFTASVSPAPRGALRVALECKVITIARRCFVSFALRLRSAPLARRSVSIRNGSRRTVRVRPRRSLRRGDVIEVRMAGAATDPVGSTTQQREAARPLLRGYAFAARWRIRL